jgi:hypothetical protein
LTIGGAVEEFEIKNTEDKETKDKTSSYVFDTSGLTYGSTILWRVCTKGIHSDYGDWSIQRTVDIYARPSVTLSLTDTNGNPIDTLTEFPMHVEATTGPITQKPIGYHLSIIANNSYEVSDVDGDIRIVSNGEEVFSKHYDINTPLSVDISAGDVLLETNVSYTLKCIATMDSGMTTENSIIFSTAWSAESYWPNAEVSIDTTSYTATIRPYCRNNAGALVKDHILAVYRRNYDGSFTKIASSIENNGGTYVTDPHPSLDYARYRIVATSTVTGKVSYYDMPGVEVDCPAIILQWDEKWTNFDTPEDYIRSEPTWTGSLLKLTYNVDVKESVSPDIAHVEYVGRAHPVGYYGTQLGETANWSTVIDKSDTPTIYALRRLARWIGKVYVREPSGSGYWATVRVSFDLTHRSVTVPVSFDITRIEGGV